MLIHHLYCPGVEVVLDTKTVSNVKASEYLVDVDVGGTFRIENVKDKFCQYPRHRNV